MSAIDELIRAEVEAAVKRAIAELRPTLLTVEEYAAHWKISESTVRHAIAQNRLEVTRNGRSVRIAADAAITRRPRDRRERTRLALLRGGSLK